MANPLGDSNKSGHAVGSGPSTGGPAELPSQKDLGELAMEAAAFFERFCGPVDEAELTGGFTLVARKRPGAPDALDAARAFQAALAQAGLAGVSLAVEYGGRGWSLAAEGVIRRTGSGFNIPNLVPLSVGLGLALPTLLGFATEDTKRQRIPRILDASEVWCQLFSEPNSGSDLASLRTGAVQEADSFIVTGQKIWSSFAQHADYGLLLARTDPASVGSRGLTMFVLPIHSRGVTVRPLRDITGGQHFNEVFLDGVVLDPEHVLGEIGCGWAVANSTLGNERSLGRSLTAGREASVGAAQRPAAGRRPGR